MRLFSPYVNIFSHFFIYYICAREGALITHRTRGCTVKNNLLKIAKFVNLVKCQRAMGRGSHSEDLCSNLSRGTGWYYERTFLLCPEPAVMFTAFLCSSDWFPFPSCFDFSVHRCVVGCFAALVGD